MFELAHLLKTIKESEEGSTHSTAALKHAVLTEMFGAGLFDWNEPADAAEAFLLVL